MAGQSPSVYQQETAWRPAFPVEAKTAKVLEMVAEGLASWEIAELMGMDTTEVKAIIPAQIPRP